MLTVKTTDMLDPRQNSQPVNRKSPATGCGPALCWQRSGRTDGRNEQTDGQKDRQTDRQTEGQTDGLTDGRTDGRTDGLGGQSTRRPLAPWLDLLDVQLDTKRLPRSGCLVVGTEIPGVDEGGGGEIPGGVCVCVCVCVCVGGWVGGEPRSQGWMKVEGVRSQEVCVCG